MALFPVAPAIWLIVNIKGNFTGKAAFFGIAVPIIVALSFTEHYLRRNDQTVNQLSETLRTIRATTNSANVCRRWPLNFD